MQTLKEMNAVLHRQLALLETENEHLRARVAELGTVNVLVFGSRTKMSVAAVTSNNPEGQHLHNITLDTFQTHEESLQVKNIGFSNVVGVRVNEVHALPFKGPPSS